MGFLQNKRFACSRPKCPGHQKNLKIVYSRKSVSQNKRPFKLGKRAKSSMFILPYNTTLWICAAIVGGIVGFIIYGLIKGFENLFPND
jgi:hypothetical protein